MSDTNTAFVGSIPEYYDKYLGPLIFEEYSIDMATRLDLPEDGALLEIAAGTGLAARHLRAALPKNATITVTDLHTSMLELAKSKFPDQQNILFEKADATDLSYADASFDVIACQFGIMFFPLKAKCIEDIFRVLKPGGNFMFSVWDSYAHNPMMNLVTDTLATLFPEDPPSFLDVPLGYHNIDEIKNLLELAGFGDIEIAVLPRTMRTNDPNNVPLGFIMGNPLSMQIPERGGNISEVISKISSEITRQFGKAPIEAPMQAIVFKAYK